MDYANIYLSFTHIHINLCKYERLFVYIVHYHARFPHFSMHKHTNIVYLTGTRQRSKSEAGAMAIH